MIKQTAEYALRAVVHLANTPDQAQTSQQIAERTHVPTRYLYKVLQALCAAELLRSQPGPNGGYSLMLPPEEISLLDVVNVVEPLARIRECPLKLDEHATRLCPLHRRLDAAYATIEATFAATTVAEILEESGKRAPLCKVS